MGLFDGYISNDAFDELHDRDGEINPHWRELYEHIDSIDTDTLINKQSEIDWRLEDNGVTFNVYNDPDGNNRPWRLDPIPFVISSSEWEHIKLGLKQRAKLLNLIFKDIYTEQKLIKDGIVPEEIIYTHKGFIREVFNLKNLESFMLKIYAVDLARGPDGKLWVINDRTQSPSGIGYAIENRLSMNAVLEDLYAKIDKKKIVRFVDGLGLMIKKASKYTQEPLVALLTPGYHNETYFEQSFLAHFLDMVLVSGEDLLTKDGFVWLKTLGGLKKVDTILRRVDDSFCDPLELRDDSTLGVSGLMQVVRENNIALLNPIGSGILENLGLNPFMKNIASYFLDEELILPQIATWWCGQEKELDYVVENFDRLVIKKIDKNSKFHTYFGSKVSNDKKKQIIEEIKKNPTVYVGQEEVSFSTTPSFVDGEIVARNSVVRAFLHERDGEYEVMEGGLVRVSSQKDSFIVTNQNGGVSKDLWILGDDGDEPIAPVSNSTQFLNTTLSNITTIKAQNLFWLGRYVTRAVITARMIRFTIKSDTSYYQLQSDEKASKILLYQVLTHITMTYPGFLDKEMTGAKYFNPNDEIYSIIADSSRVGSLSYTIGMLSLANLNVKDMLTLDSWRVYDKVTKEWEAFVSSKNRSNRIMVNELNKLITYLLAYSELIGESMSDEQGLLLYQLGQKLEGSIMLINKTRALLTSKHSELIQHNLLEAMIITNESYNSYRATYHASLDLEDVIKFVLYDSNNQKSLVSRLDKILVKFKNLPQHNFGDLLNSFEKPIFQAYSRLRLTSYEDLIVEEEGGVLVKFDELLSELSQLLTSCADELTKHYFAHYEE